MRGTIKTKPALRLLLAAAAGLLLSTVGFLLGDRGSPVAAQEGAEIGRVDIAAFEANGDLIRPEGLEEWVFLGSSLGMGYNSGEFDPDSPGQFQIVLMEPRAYAYLKEHGHYADGSMFLLQFFGVAQRLSNNKTGFVMGGLNNYEIHVRDRAKFDDGRAFYIFQPEDASAEMLPAGNDCVTCHVRDGAFDGTFVQFYPTIRHQIPPEALKKALDKGEEDIH